MENQQHRESLYANILSSMIKVETISTYESPNLEKFESFLELLKKSFPNIFRVAELEVYEGSILLKWKGKTASGKPVLYMNHQDVVEAPGEWKHGPFSGEIAENAVWGRGTLDTKGGLFAMLMASDELVSQGFQPNNDIYFVSSCNEETTSAGAKKISEILKNRNIQFDYIIDEGGMIILENIISGVKGEFAMIGVGEKAYVDLKFIAKSKGGHASAPPYNTPLIRLSKFMLDVEKKNVFQSKMNPAIAEMFRRYSKTSKGAIKVIIGHPRFFSLLITKVVAKFSPELAAMVRTTIAFTMASGSDGRNVIPETAFVIGNMRCSHHEGIDHSIEQVRRIAKKYDIDVEILDLGISSKLSDYRSPQFSELEKTIKNTFPQAETIPYLMRGASDCRYFDMLSDNCFRFLPIKITDEQLSGIHGLNENISISSLIPAVDYYKSLMEKR